MGIHVIENSWQKFSDILLFVLLQKHILQIKHCLQLSIVGN
jgi:hypothetical protein